jgi:hypothetical protein
MTAAPRQLLTQNQFARHIGVSAFQLSRLVRRGFLPPNFIASQVRLFNPERVPIVKRAIQETAK